MRNPCVAHRGASGEAPENTLAAVKQAMSYPFVQWVELDVQLTRDGVPVLLHDETVNRTTSGKGKLSGYDLEALKQLDAGRWFGRSFKGERVPTLQEALQLTAGRLRCNLELKTYGNKASELERQVVELVYANGLQYDTVITSFDAAALRRVRQLSEHIQTGLIVDAAPASLVQDMQALGARLLSIGYTHVNANRLQVWRQAGLQVMAWTVNEPTAIRRLARLDPKLMICTNYPERWQQAIGPLSRI